MRLRRNPYDYDIYGDSMYDEEDIEDFEDEDIISDPEDFDEYLPPRNWRFDIRKDDVEFINHKRPNPWLDEDADYDSDDDTDFDSDDTDNPDLEDVDENEVLEEGSAPFNDKYFPRVDLSNPRYSYYHYKGKDFAYDNQKKLVLLIYQDNDEGEDAPWREVDAIGLSPENWKDREVRKEYLDEYCDDIDAQLEYELEYL